MASYIGKTARQQEMEKLFNRMCGKHSPYEVWQDMVWMIATSISNAVDKRYFDQREERYMHTAKKYSKEEIDAFPKFFNHIVMGMEEDPDCDFLGELYMGLNLGNQKQGQFFTPYSLCRMMAEVTMDESLLQEQIEKNGWVSIDDPACGAGATLVAAANILRARQINYQTQALFIGQDVDTTVALMCYIQLSLLGCPGYVIIGDTLSEPPTGPALFGEDSERCWYTPMYFTDCWTLRRLRYGRQPGERCAVPATAALSDAAAPGPISSMPEPESLPETPEDGCSATLTVSEKKKNAGQMMFNFGGGI